MTDMQTPIVETPDGLTTPAEKHKAITECLAHVRGFSIFHADMRTKHFHFFVIAMIPTAAGVIERPKWALIISLVGMLLSFAFVVLDKRVFRLIKDSRAELERLERMIGIHFHDNDRIKDPALRIYNSTRRRVFTTTNAYNFVYLMGAVGFGATFVAHLFPLLRY